jgi:hypothetical protein
VRGYVVDVYFCVFDVSVEEFGAGFGLGFRIGIGIGFRLEIGLGLGIALVDVGYLDIATAEVNIYNIASHKGLKGEIDTRLLTKNGRIQIAKDIKKSGMITSAIQQIVNTDKSDVWNRLYHVMEKVIM